MEASKPLIWINSKKSFLTKFKDSDHYYVEMGTYIPKHVTDEQIMKIREITGIRFHELSVFEDVPMFYAIWLPASNKFRQVEYGDAKNAIFFFNSYDEALTNASEQYWYRDERLLHGTLSELSDQPELLKSFIAATEGIEYNDDLNKLEFYYPFRQNGGFGALNALLKQPLFEIREFPYEQAKDVPHEPFEWI